MRRSCQVRIRASFWALFLTTAFGLFLNIGSYLLFARSWLALPMAMLASILFAALACDFAELTLAVFCRPHFPARLSRLSSSPKVALLYATRHDARAECLKSLAAQHYNNADVFILDDSDDDRQISVVEGCGLILKRRGTRKGYKAGNLNNWLKRYAKDYPYFVVADADSKFSSDFVVEMLKYAEHPENKDVAIFQSKILPWNKDQRFARTIGLGATMRMRVTERIGNSLNTLLSYGHNNLHRTEAILSAGGFDESLSPEDTAISLKLSEFGRSCQMVDVVSYDAEPADLATYLRRASRWCQQTIEISCRPWRRAQTGLKLAVCRNLAAYCLYLVYPALLVATLLQPGVDLDVVMNSLRYLIWAGRYDVLLIWVFPLVVLAANLCLNLWHARRAGVPTREYVRHVLLSVAITNFCVPAVAKAFRRHFSGLKVRFDPTNEIFAAHGWKSWRESFSRSWFVVLLASVSALIAWMRPANLLVSGNLVWLGLAVVSPAVVWRAHSKPQTPRRP